MRSSEMRDKISRGGEGAQIRHKKNGKTPQSRGFECANDGEGRSWLCIERIYSVATIAVMEWLRVAEVGLAHCGTEFEPDHKHHRVSACRWLSWEKWRAWLEERQELQSRCVKKGPFNHVE